jgi:hypothetical protein
MSRTKEAGFISASEQSVAICNAEYHIRSIYDGTGRYTTHTWGIAGEFPAVYRQPMQIIKNEYPNYDASTCSVDC